MARRFSVVFGAALWLVGCATTAPKQQPPPSMSTTVVELAVRDMDPEMVAELQAEMQKIPELRSATVKSTADRTTTFTIHYPGDVGRLPQVLSRLPHPGLKYISAAHRFDYGAYDNQPPTIAFIHPQTGQLLNAQEQFVTVEVPDKDVEHVTIGGKQAPRYKGNIFRLKVQLTEGAQELVAVAKDKGGNEATAVSKVTVDTTAPALQAQIKLLVEGLVEPGSSILIDGQEVSVSGSGQYRAEVPVRKGQRTVEIVALDGSGNKTVTVKTIGE